MRRYILSKIDKLNALLKNKRLRKYVPVTKEMNASVLSHMLAKYQMVYVKPDIGTYGNGVIRVERLAKKEAGAASESSGSSKVTETLNISESSLSSYLPGPPRFFRIGGHRQHVR